MPSRRARILRRLLFNFESAVPVPRSIVSPRKRFPSVSASASTSASSIPSTSDPSSSIHSITHSCPPSLTLAFITFRRTFTFVCSAYIITLSCFASLVSLNPNHLRHFPHRRLSSPLRDRFLFDSGRSVRSSRLDQLTPLNATQIRTSASLSSDPVFRSAQSAQDHSNIHSLDHLLLNVNFTSVFDLASASASASSSTFSHPS